MNDDQTENSLKSLFPVSLSNVMEPAKSVKNLGVILDVDNSMQSQNWVLHPVQQTGSCWDSSSALPLVGLKPTEVTAYD